MRKQQTPSAQERHECRRVDDHRARERRVSKPCDLRRSGDGEWEQVEQGPEDGLALLAAGFVDVHVTSDDVECETSAGHEHECFVNPDVRHVFGDDFDLVETSEGQERRIPEGGSYMWSDRCRP